MIRRFLTTLCALAYLVAATGAQAGFVINSYGFATAAPAPTFAYVTTVFDIVDATTYTYPATSIGTADPTRKLVFIPGCKDSATNFSIDTLTVNAAGATEVVDNSADTGAVVQTAIYIKDHPTGTVADLELTTSEGTTNCAIAVYAAYNLSSSTATDTAAQFQTSSANIDLSMDTVIGDLCFGGSYDQNETQAATWAGLAEDAETEVTGEAEISVASLTAASASTPLTIGADWTGTGDSIGVGTCFR